MNANTNQASSNSTSVRICGAEYSDCEVIQQGEFCGLKAGSQTFWLFPVCDDEGRRLTTLPPFLPLEIRPVTCQVPDLTAEFPETVQHIFDVRRRYFEKISSFEQYQLDKPNDSVTEGDFLKAREIILAQTLNEFSRANHVKHAVWRMHGSVESANEVGYMGDVWESRQTADGKEERILPSMSVADGLNIRLGHGHPSAETDAIVKSLRYVMIYDAGPGQRFIYLSGIKESRSPRPRRVEIGIELITRKEQGIAVVCPDLERMEKAFEKGESVARATARNLKTQEAQLRERAKQAVTHKQVREALGVGERQVRNILKREGMTSWPANQQELELLLARQRDYQEKLARARARRNGSRKRTHPPTD